MSSLFPSEIDELTRERHLVDLRSTLVRHAPRNRRELHLRYRIQRALTPRRRHRPTQVRQLIAHFTATRIDES